MTKRERLLYGLIGVLAALGPLRAQDQATKTERLGRGFFGPPGAPVRSLTIDKANPSTVYASTGNGVYKTTDDGVSWAAVNNGFKTLVVQTVVIDPNDSNILYAGTAAGQFGIATDAGVYKSTDAGATWFQINNGFTSFVQVPAIAIDPQDSNVLYCISAGVKKTVNGGQSWQSTDLVAGGVRALVVDRFDSNKVYAGVQAGFRRSLNGGATFNPAISLGSAVLSLAIDPITNAFYAGTEENGIFKSVNGGTTWTAMNTGLSPGQVFELEITPTAIYAGTSDGAFKSTDEGRTWSRSSNGLPGFLVLSLAAKPDSSIVYAGTVSEVFKAEDDAATWSQLDTGLRGASHQWIFSVTVPPEDARTAFVTVSAAGVFKTIDAGRSWSEINRGLPNASTRDLITEPGNPQTLYVAMALLGGVGRASTAARTGFRRASTICTSSRCLWISARPRCYMRRSETQPREGCSSRLTGEIPGLGRCRGFPLKKW
jgi:photosystem II stability/assembly factor-like uncharacterized protein